MNTKQTKSLQPKIILIILSFAIVPLVIFSIIGLFFTQNNIKKTTVNEIIITTQILTNSIQTYMDERISTIRQLSQADVFETDDYSAINQYIKEIYKASHEIKALKVYNLDGKLLADAATEYINIEENTKSFFEQYSFGKDLIEQIKNSSQGRVFIKFQLDNKNEDNIKSELILITPITDDSNKKVIKILVEELSLSQYQNSFLSITENSISNIKNLLIFDENGQIVNDYNSFENGLTLRSSNGFFDDIMAHSNSNDNYYETEEYYIGHSNINLNLGEDTILTWHLVATAKKNNTIITTQALTSLLLTLIIAIISILIISRIVKMGFVPFKNSLLTLEKIKEGDYSQKLNQFHSGELFLLQNSFNSLLDKINHSFNELNKSVEREKELGILKTNFIAMASHEFRTPLAVLSAAAEVILKYKDQLKPEDIDKRMKIIKTKVDEMTLMIEEVLILSSADSNNIQFNSEELNLQQLIKKSIDEFQLTQKEQRKIAFNFQEADYQIKTDKKWIKHIVSNLLSNAAKYSNSDTEIEVNLKATQSEISFSIKDQGIGIPSEDLKYLFNFFHRASNVGDIQGTGLGLAIIKKGLELLKGTISVDSEEGKGSIFTVHLPK